MTVVLFDVDGVFLSEERCFDVSALAVHELLYSPRYLNLDTYQFRTDYSDKEINEIRAETFSNDEVLDRFKQMGLNSNWDMLFVTFSIVYIELMKDAKLNVENVDIADIHSVGEMLGLQKANYAKVVDFLKADDYTKDTIYDALMAYVRRNLGIEDAQAFEMSGPIWRIGQYKYQEWYLGSRDVKTSTGIEPEEADKPGFIHDEEWIVDPEDIRGMLNRLLEAGVEIGVATGRPRQETLIPFQQERLTDIFRDNRISTASEVLAAEAVDEVEVSLAKPHPYSYLWSLYAHDVNRFKDAVDQNNISDDLIFIIGDSVADYYCAESIGSEFIATLTGLTGHAIIPRFEALGVEHMVDTVLGVEEIILKSHHS
ncbi:HAD family hydrolase [Salinicoccus cyprini]|uniref:HAD family hydrolase n=1 Tax=Salinicoccus cyprini TaxID=2493691 RepID=A0A558AVA0_9STAP|nr:HAD hydrolase-like protein [Salinicoccus cyprini]TVT28179.1 HAD family hydrolase [Salinicoccus cyprini]